ncbi:MAG: 4Fe-4S binding protein [Christensenellales bacterium]|jgi:ferredoxin
MKLKDSIIRCLKKNHADIVGFAPAERFADMGVYELMPEAKTVIGAAFRMLRGAYSGMELGTTFYQYPAAIQCIEETIIPLALLRCTDVIEEAGYISLPLRRQMLVSATADEANPEVIPSAVYRNIPTESHFDFVSAGVLCQLGERGVLGTLLTDYFGPMQRLGFIITDVEIEPTADYIAHLCDHCGKCADACPGNAISKDGMVDGWQCAAYYAGLNRSTNPFMPEDALSNEPEREAILEGSIKLGINRARRLINEIHYYGGVQYGYAPCICARACHLACYRHLMEKGVLRNRRLTAVP